MAFPSDLSRDSTSPEHMQLKAGQRVFNKRYELKRMLAPGGMGVVWMALDHAGKKNVALKFLPSILVHHEKEMQSLRAQVDVGQQLRHDLIVATYGQEVEAALAAIVLEFVEGQTLKQKLEACERGFFEPQEIEPWLADITSALSYLHEQKALVHRDIKPANIIVTMAGRARLLDFGISQSIQETMGRHTQTGAVQGTSNTLAYASPESLGLRHKPAVSDDIYSLGATLYELLTGTPPFYQGKPEVIALHIETKFPPSVMQRREELVEDGMNKTVGQAVDARWQALVSACLAKDPAQRPSTAAAVLQRLSAEAPIVSPSGEKKPRARVLPRAILCGGIALATYAIWPGPPVSEKPKEVIVVKEVPKEVIKEVPVKDPETERQLLEEKLKREDAERKLADSQKPRPSPPAAALAPTPPPAAMRVLRAEPVSPLDDGTIGKPIQLKLPGSVIMKLCYCPAGSFTMGSPASEADRSDDEDQVQVRLSQGFWLGQTEVTQAQWQALMGSNPSNFKGDDLPVEWVSWEEAQAFISKLNTQVALPGWRWALPTEAQWEYACRAGTKTPFAFGSTLTSEQANFGPNLGKTSPVGSYKANEWGLYDMHGNVWEWCEDAWDGTAKLLGGTDPLSTTGSNRVLRGGSWGIVAAYCAAGFRGRYDPDARNSSFGFRLASVPASGAR